MADKMTVAALDYRQLSTILAALRYWQDEMQSDGFEADGPHFLDCTPLDVEEVDALCEALNCSERPSVVCNISGGLLQGASSTIPLDVYALDFDTEGCEPSELIDVDGSEAWLGQEAAAVDPDFVQSVIDAPTLDEEQ